MLIISIHNCKNVNSSIHNCKNVNSSIHNCKNVKHKHTHYIHNCFEMWLDKLKTYMYSINYKTVNKCMYTTGAYPGGEAQGACPPPWKLKSKKKRKKIIRANFKLFHLYFATFFSRKYHFICYFLRRPLPLIIEKQKKKTFKFSKFKITPYEFLDTPLYKKRHCV